MARHEKSKLRLLTEMGVVRCRFIAPLQQHQRRGRGSSGKKSPQLLSLRLPLPGIELVAGKLNGGFTGMENDRLGGSALCRNPVYGK